MTLCWLFIERSISSGLILFLREMRTISTFEPYQKTDDVKVQIIIFAHTLFVTLKRLYRDWYCVKGVRIWSYSGPNFPAFGLNTERYVSLCILSECWKMRTRIIPNTDTFHAVWKLHKIFWGSKRKCEKSALNFYINRIFQESGVKKTKPVSNLKSKDNCQY